MKRVWNKPKAGDCWPDWLQTILGTLSYKFKKIKILKLTVEFEEVKK